MAFSTDRQFAAVFSDAVRADRQQCIQPFRSLLAPQESADTRRQTAGQLGLHARCRTHVNNARGTVSRAAATAAVSRHRPLKDHHEAIPARDAALAASQASRNAGRSSDSRASSTNRLLACPAEAVARNGMRVGFLMAAWLTGAVQLIARTQRRGRPGFSPVFPVCGQHEASHHPPPGPLRVESQGLESGCQVVPAAPPAAVAWADPNDGVKACGSGCRCG